MLGMIIGVAAVMTMVALGNGAQASVEDEMKSAGTNLVYVSAGNYTRGGDDVKVAAGLGAAKTLVAADGEAIAAKVKGIKHWSPGVADRAPMIGRRRSYFGRVIGASADFAPIHSWTMRRGADVHAGDVASRRDGRGARHDRRASVCSAPGADPVGRDVHHPQETVHGRRASPTARSRIRPSRCSCRSRRCRRCEASRISTR